MSLPQLTALAIVGLMMSAFLWGRVRYDLVAACALLLAVILGVVPAAEAFSGFSDDIVIIVGSALVVSAAVSRSGVVDAVIARVAPNVTTPWVQLLILVTVLATISGFVKNIGALAIMLPVAFQMAQRSKVSPSMFLMPMSFAALLGGLVTQIGTSPNIIVSRMREDLTGQSFGMFDFAPLGIALSVVGVIFLAAFYWLVPQRKRETLSVKDAIEIKNYTTEAAVVENSAVRDETVAALHKLGGGRAMVTTIVSGKGGRRTPLPDAVLRLGDRLILEGEPDALNQLVSQGGLALADRANTPGADLVVTEAIVGPNSPLIGRSARDYALYERTGIDLVAVSRRESRFTDRIGTIQLEPGDVILLRGTRPRLAEQLRELDALPLADRDLQFGSIRNRFLPLIILAGAIVATGLGWLPVAVAFFAAAVLIVLTGALPSEGLYRRLDGPILVMLGALIPVSDSLRTTGATDVMASWLSQIAAGLPPYGALALILVAAMAVTPFLNNAAAVLVMAPIAATFATDLGLRPEAFLMAVAIGAGCDFLTPIGHQCNTLVMGPGGYRFGDYWRLGLPLSVLVVLVAVPLLQIVWPLT